MFQNRRLFAADESSEVGALCMCTGALTTSISQFSRSLAGFIHGT